MQDGIDRGLMKIIYSYNQDLKMHVVTQSGTSLIGYTLGRYIPWPEDLPQHFLSQRAQDGIYRDLSDILSSERLTSESGTDFSFLIIFFLIYFFICLRNGIDRGPMGVMIW